MALKPDQNTAPTPTGEVSAAPEGVPASTPLPAFQSTSRQAQNPDQPREEFAKPKKASTGEKWWHGITYGGFGYLANLAVSVVLWDYFISGGGKPVYHGIQRGATALLRGAGANTQQAQSMGGAAAKYIFSPLGGHFTMVPVKLAEDHARYITHKLNCALDADYQYKDLKADWNTPEADLPPLADEPTRNTWGQVAIRRGLGWASVIGSGMALRATKLEQPLEDWTIKVMNSGVNLTGSKGLKQLSQTPRAQRYVQLAALDSYLTAVTTVVTALTKKTFGTARDNTLADDALSIDIPGLTEIHNGKHNSKPAAHPSSKPTHSAPPEETPGEAKSRTDERNERSYRQAVTPRSSLASPEKSASFVESHHSRQQATEKDAGKHLSA